MRKGIKSPNILAIILIVIAIALMGTIMTRYFVQNHVIRNNAKYEATKTSNTEDGRFEYIELEDGTIEISKYMGTDTEVTIPSAIDGKTVTSIGERTFLGCISITKVEIPVGVTSIKKLAFWNCSSLTSIEIPEGVTSIGLSAFAYCKSLTSIDLPKGITSIASHLFYECESLTSITILESVTNIEQSAFSKCSSLKSIKIPKGVTSIGNSVFSGCTSLTSIEIPEGVTIIKNSAFYGCKSLENIDVQGKNMIIEKYAFSFCTSLTSVELPKGVTSIGYSAFAYCTSLTNIKLQEGLTCIGDYAFSGCSSLTSIEIPEEVISIGDYAFDKCSSLTKVKISKEVESIGQRVFSGCSSLINIEVDANNQQYSDEGGILLNNDKTILICYPAGKLFTTYKILDSVTRINNYAFEGCNNLNKIEITEKVTNIGQMAFIRSTNLTNIEVDSNNQCYSSENGMLLNKDKTRFICCPAGKQVTIDILPESVTTIGAYAFSYCTNLTTFIIPEGVTSIGMSAFWNCTNLTSVTISEGVTTLVNDSFVGCSSLKSIIIPNSVTTIANFAFSSCSGFTIYCKTNSTAQVYADSNSISYIIDDEAPKIERVTGNPIELTNRSVTLTINEAEDNLAGLALKPYSFDGGETWQVENTKTYEENTDGIVIKVKDALGNVYTHEEINITKIGEASIEIESEKYDIENLHITKIQPETTVENFKSNLQIIAEEINIYNENKKLLIDDNIIATGMQLELVLGAQIETYTLVVTGDTNGDGEADFKDLTKVNSHRLNKTPLEDEYLLAADVNGDGVADFKDLVLINKFRLHKIIEL